jgi:histidine kinase
MNVDTANNFILSDKTSTIVTRHLTLWLCFCIYFLVVNFFPQNWNDLVNPKAYILASQKLIYIPVSIFSAYVAGYFLLPRFILKGKYSAFLLLMICLCLINLVSAWLLTKFLVAIISPLPFRKMPTLIRVDQPVIYGIGLGLAASWFAIIAKLLKYRYLKQKENERLQQQKINTELKIIKTNVHPLFLSDALRNIANLIRKGSKESPKVILALSDLLSYTLYDSEKERVPMEEELQMIKEYLSLEKTFHSDRIIIKLHETGEMGEMTIPPLILLSLVQNTCEQLLVSLQQKPVLDMRIKTEDKNFLFAMRFNGYYKIMNGIVNPDSALSKALRRIEILFGREVIETRSHEEFFSIDIFLKSETLFRKGESIPREKSSYATE